MVSSSVVGGIVDDVTGAIVGDYGGIDGDVDVGVVAGASVVCNVVIYGCCGIVIMFGGVVDVVVVGVGVCVGVGLFDVVVAIILSYVLLRSFPCVVLLLLV